MLIFNLEVYLIAYHEDCKDLAETLFTFIEAINNPHSSLVAHYRFLIGSASAILIYYTVIRPNKI